MQKILISLTSYNKKEEPHLQEIIKSYIEEFSDGFELFFCLSINYDHFHAPSNSILIPKKYEGWQFTWQNKEYINEHYKHYNFIIESDADINISYSNFQYYVKEANELSFDYIPGFMTMERGSNRERHLITLPPSLPRISDKIQLNNKSYFTPYNLHSAMFIVDRDRFQLALDKGMKSEPYRWKYHTEAETSRTAVYSYFKKVIPIDSIQNNLSLVSHLPNKYWHHPLVRYSPFLTVDKFLAEIA